MSWLLGIAGVLMPLAVLLYQLISILTGKGDPHADSGMTISDTVIMLSIFMVLAEAFIDGGFGSALIQKKVPTQED